MKNIISVLQKTSLFGGITPDETEKLLNCLQARIVRYSKGDYVFRKGDKISSVAILADGNLLIQSDDYWGNRSIVGTVECGDLFGEAYALSGKELMLNDVISTEESRVIFIDISKIFGICSNACQFHSHLVYNLLVAVSSKNIQLVQKLGHMSKRSTAEKLLSYLSQQAQKCGSSKFEIPFNRQQLADFLSVDRSAMSNELCKLRDKKLIRFNKNKFELL